MEFGTKNNYAYEKLKGEIVEGKLRPGERIVISEIANRYNVSPMPIREAINRLHQEGFVEVIPHVGARVSPFDLEKYKEIMLIRIELESLAAKLSTAYIDNQTITRLETISEQMEKCLRDREYLEYGRLNMEFHLLIYNAGPYKILSELISSLWGRSEFSRTAFFKIPERNEASLVEHKAWLEAIKAKDAEKAAQILRYQKETSTTMFLEYLEKSQ